MEAITFVRWSRSLALVAVVWVLTTFLSGQALVAETKDCDRLPLGVLPLNDLESGTYSRDGGTPMPGGLYPDGNNEIPLQHKLGGLAAADLVEPLDLNGQTTGTDKKIVIAGIGYSNTTHFFSELGVLVGDNKSSDVVFERLSSGRAGTHVWADPDNPDNPIPNPWETASTLLSNHGFSPLQVQVVVHQHALPRRDDGHVPGPWPDTTPADAQGMMEEIARLTLEYFPNTQLALWVSNDYQGWGTGETDEGIRPEPYRYESGFATKWMLERQIDGAPDLSYDPANRVAPWMAWADYNWTDGLNMNKDRLSSPCESYQSDGTHLGTPLRLPLALRLHDFFQTSPLTRWFRPAAGYRPAVALIWPWEREEEARPRVLLQALASYNGSQKSVAQVEFLLDDVSVGVDETPPYVHQIEDLPKGKYRVRARVHGEDLETWDTESVPLTVVDVGDDLLVTAESFESGSLKAGWGWLDNWALPDPKDPMYVRPFLTTEDDPENDFQLRMDASSFATRLTRLGVTTPELDFLWKGELSQDELFEVSFSQVVTPKTVLFQIVGPVSQTDFSRVQVDMGQFPHALSLAADFRFEISSSTGSDHILLDNVFLKRVDAIDSFTDWAARKGVTADVTGNPDGDDLNNLREYAFVTDPLVHTTVAQAGNWQESVTELSVDYRLLHYRKYATRTDISFTIQEKRIGLGWETCLTCVDQLGAQAWPLETHRVLREESPDLEGLRVVVSYTP